MAADWAGEAGQRIRYIGGTGERGGPTAALPLRILIMEEIHARRSTALTQTRVPHYRYV